MFVPQSAVTCGRIASRPAGLTSTISSVLSEELKYFMTFGVAMPELWGSQMHGIVLVPHLLSILICKLTNWAEMDAVLNKTYEVFCQTDYTAHSSFIFGSTRIDERCNVLCENKISGDCWRRKIFFAFPVVRSQRQWSKSHLLTHYLSWDVLPNCNVNSYTNGTYENCNSTASKSTSKLKFSLWECRFVGT